MVSVPCESTQEQLRFWEAPLSLLLVAVFVFVTGLVSAEAAAQTHVK